MPDEQRISVESESGVVAARQAGRQLAEQIGFTSTEQTLIATAISEMARNILQYAGTGFIRIGRARKAMRFGIEVVAADEGPGIKDLEKAFQDGYTTGKGMGMGIPGSRRLVDEFEIDTAANKGTTVTMRKWLQPR